MMPIYALYCDDCGNAWDEIQTMAERGLGKPWPACGRCQSAPRRLYGPQPDPYGETTFKTIVTDQLSDDGNPVEIHSREDWHRRMKERGVMPREAGMDYSKVIIGQHREREAHRDRLIDKEARAMYRLGINPNQRVAERNENRRRY
jgi:putative FmdB family regulatory protein